MILDTSFLVDVLRGDAVVEETVATVDECGTAQVSAVTVMELWEGIHLATATEDERAAVGELLEGLHELPFDRECATVAGEISAGLRDSGEPIDDADVMIAATARVHDVPVVTRNVDHFERIDDLDLVAY